VIQTPDGSIYTINSDYATILGLNPRGGRMNLADTIRFEAPEIVACIASDSEGMLYVPNRSGGYIYRVDPLNARLLDNLECSVFKNPRGIALGNDDNFYVSDMGSNQVHVITKEGQLLASFGGPDVFECPRNVHVDGNGRVYVVDCPKEGNVGTSPGKVHVFRKSSSGKGKFEPALTIDGINWVECVTTDRDGRIYAGCHDGIHVFDVDGKAIAHWASKPYGNLSGGTIVAGLAWDRKTGDLLVTQGFTVRQLIRVPVSEILADK
jgi:DNA-binding beta-propeller fold protein YncE